MSTVECVGIGPSDRSGKESVADKTHRQRLGIDPVADTAGRMARCGKTTDAETSDRDDLSIVRGSKTILRRFPMQETDIVRSQIDRNFPPCQEFLNPLCVVRMPMCEADACQPDSMGIEPGDQMIQRADLPLSIVRLCQSPIQVKGRDPQRARAVALEGAAGFPDSIGAQRCPISAKCSPHAVSPE